MIKIELNEITGKIEIEEKYKDREYRLAQFMTMIRTYWEELEKKEKDYADYFKEEITRMFKEDLVFADMEKLKEKEKEAIKELLDKLFEDVIGNGLKARLEKLKKEEKKSKTKKSKKD